MIIRNGPAFLCKFLTVIVNIENHLSLSISESSNQAGRYFDAGHRVEYLRRIAHFSASFSIWNLVAPI